MAKPKIAFVAASLEILGGQGVQANSLLENLRSEGYDVTLFPVNPTFPRGFRWLRRFPFIRTVINQALFIPSLLALRSADVVHIFSASYWSFLLGPALAIVAGKLFRKRVVLNYHSGYAEDHLAHWGRLVHPWLKMADEIVVPSDYLSKVFARYGYRARVVRNVIDTSHFGYRERFTLRPRLLSIRNLEPHYRVDNNLKAFAIVRKHYPEASLTVAGYGSEEARLRRLADSFGAYGVRFVGRVEPSSTPSLYEEADIFINSSIVDNQPLSILEAFAAGLPVVSTGTGDIAAMVRHGEAGLIVSQEDPESMAKAIMTLLENPDRALDMARLAREEVATFTWPRVKKAWGEVYLGNNQMNRNTMADYVAS